MPDYKIKLAITSNSAAIRLIIADDREFGECAMCVSVCDRIYLRERAAAELQRCCEALRRKTMTERIRICWSFQRVRTEVEQLFEESPFAYTKNTLIKKKKNRHFDLDVVLQPK